MIRSGRFLAGLLYLAGILCIFPVPFRVLYVVSGPHPRPVDIFEQLDAPYLLGAAFGFFFTGFFPHVLTWILHELQVGNALQARIANSVPMDPSAPSSPAPASPPRSSRPAPPSLLDFALGPPPAPEKDARR